MSNDWETVSVSGIPCRVSKGYYTYTVPGWKEITTHGIKDTRRVINARLDPANYQICRYQMKSEMCDLNVDIMGMEKEYMDKIERIKKE